MCGESLSSLHPKMFCKYMFLPLRSLINGKRNVDRITKTSRTRIFFHKSWYKMLNQYSHLAHGELRNTQLNAH